MFENRSQQSKTEVNARTERSQNSSHEQTSFLLKKKPVESSSRKNRKHVKKPHGNKKTTNEKWKFGSNKKQGLD